MRSDGRGVALGIDVGGTGVKSALIELPAGRLLTRRVRADTPRPATPDAVAATVRQVFDQVAAEHPVPADAPVGCGLPGVVKVGRLLTAANLDKSWVGVSAEELISEALGRPVLAINDADAAGVAEVSIGAARDMRGTVLLLTIGTGIGSALLVDGRLVPNTEFGHIEINGRDAEKRLSGAARERRRLRWTVWAEEFNGYLARVEAYVWPDLIILGGGVSKVIDRYVHILKTRAPIVPAKFLNTAGIIGAAIAASDRHGRRPGAADATREPASDAQDAVAPSSATG